jgi:hypothetical protein
MLALGAGVLAMSGPGIAAEWRHTITPYVWVAGLSGQTGVGTPLGPLTVDVDVGFSDLLENLDFGGMVAWRSDRDRLSIMADVIYLKLSADRTVQAGPVPVDGSAEADQAVAEASIGYRWNPNVTVYAGLRYFDIDMSLRAVAPPPVGTRAADDDESWVDPMVGALFEIPLSESWTLGLRGDLGGFGVGSDITPQAVLSARWHLSERTTIVGAFRYVDIDYEDGSGRNLFKYDVTIAGPSIGVSFSF